MIGQLFDDYIHLTRKGKGNNPQRKERIIILIAIIMLKFYFNFLFVPISPSI